jgi:hypothetical protein
MATAAAQTPTTTCPGCGARIPATVSICPYCVTPLRTGGAKPQEGESGFVERLRHMREKPEFQQGLAFTPLEGPRYRVAMTRGRIGLAFAVVGAILAGNALASAAPIASVRVLGGALLVALGAWRGAQALRVRRETLALPLLKRAARVADRRSETGIRGSRGETIYFFELELEDGTQAEFLYPGRGAAEDVLTNGVTGVAYTRGRELLAFKRIRV